MNFKRIYRLFHSLLNVVGEQLMNGSPEYPSGQVQAGVWFITVQRAFKPQDPGQGSLHFS